VHNFKVEEKSMLVNGQLELASNEPPVEKSRPHAGYCQGTIRNNMKISDKFENDSYSTVLLAKRQSINLLKVTVYKMF
jgi:hypothetical protein